jgi:hypothetical protein
MDNVAALTTNADIREQPSVASKKIRRNFPSAPKAVDETSFSAPSINVKREVMKSCNGLVALSLTRHFTRRPHGVARGFSMTYFYITFTLLSLKCRAQELVKGTFDALEVH